MGAQFSQSVNESGRMAWVAFRCKLVILCCVMVIGGNII